MKAKLFTLINIIKNGLNKEEQIGNLQKSISGKLILSDRK